MPDMQCPHCKNPIYDDEALLCHFCGNSLNRSSTGAFGALRSTGMKWALIAIALLIVLAFLLTSGWF